MGHQLLAVPVLEEVQEAACQEGCQQAWISTTLGTLNYKTCSTICPSSSLCSCLEALWEAAMLQVLPAFWVGQEDQELDRQGQALTLHELKNRWRGILLLKVLLPRCSRLLELVQVGEPVLELKDRVPGQLQLFQCLLLRLEELDSRQPRSNLATSNLFFQTSRYLLVARPLVQEVQAVHLLICPLL